MAQSFAQKQAAWLTRWSQLAVSLMNDLDQAAELANEYAQDAYGTGGANAINDAAVQGVLPASTALLIAEAVGVVNGSGQLLAIAGQGTTGRAYLEMSRP